MNTESVQCRRLPAPFPEAQLTPGDFCWGEEKVDRTRYLYIVLPGSVNPDALRCYHGPDRGIEREWSWDGDEEKPTLTPSILDPGNWHGYLRAGRLESC